MHYTEDVHIARRQHICHCKDYRFSDTEVQVVMNTWFSTTVDIVLHVYIQWAAIGRMVQDKWYHWRRAIGDIAKKQSKSIAKKAQRNQTTSSMSSKSPLRLQLLKPAIQICTVLIRHRIIIITVFSISPNIHWFNARPQSAAQIKA